MNPLLNTGALDDTRPLDERVKDYSHTEVGFATLPNWQEKVTFKFFDKRDQDGSLTCGAQSGAKALGIENHKEEGKFITFSALPIYQQRTNSPSGGMMLVDVLGGCVTGSTLEEYLKSQLLGETAANKAYVLLQRDKDVIEKYKAGGYVPDVSVNIDTIASITDQDKGVVIAIFFQEDEWRKTFVVNNPNLTRDNALRHFIVVTDYTLIDGKKYLIVEDSANGVTSIGQKGQRLMSEDFFNRRCYGAGYLLDRPNTAPDKPKYVFLRPLQYGMMNHPDVKALQDVLKYEGFLNKAVPSTGNYLDLTAASYLKWAVNHNLAPLNQLNGGKNVGPLGRQLLNKLYN